MSVFCHNCMPVYACNTVSVRFSPVFFVAGPQPLLQQGYRRNAMVTFHLSGIRAVLVAITGFSVLWGMTGPAWAGPHGRYGYYHDYHHVRYGPHRIRHAGYPVPVYSYRGSGKAAAIALGIVGGAVILDGIFRAAPYGRSCGNTPRGYACGYAGGYREGYADGHAVAGEYARVTDGFTAGALPGAGQNPEPDNAPVDGIYRSCIRHIRTGLAEKGFIVSVPAVPDTVAFSDAGREITASVMLDRAGESLLRQMICTTSADGTVSVVLI